MLYENKLRRDNVLSDNSESEFRTKERREMNGLLYEFRVKMKFEEVGIRFFM